MGLKLVQEQISAEEFNQEIQEKIERALSYPFGVPKDAFCFIRGETYKISKLNLKCISSSRIKVDGQSGDVEISKLMLKKHQERFSQEINEFNLVFSFGSNTSNVQLKRKFHKKTNKPILNIPYEINGYELAYSAHIAPYGSCPLTMIKSPGNSVKGFLTLLTDEDLAIMHKSEALGVNYTYAHLEGSEFAFEGHSLDRISTYFSKSGPLKIDGKPVTCAIEYGEDPVPSQEVVQKMIQKSFGHDKSFEDYIHSLVTDSTFAENVREHLIEIAGEFDCLPYSNSNYFKVSSSNEEDRDSARDDYVVAINKTEAKRLGIKGSAVISYRVRKGSRQHESLTEYKYLSQQPNKKEEAIEYKYLYINVKVLLKDDVPVGQCRVDQSVRNSIGIPYQQDNNHVRIHPLHVSLRNKIRSIATFFFGKRYVFLRVNKSTIKDLEKGICRVTEDSFELLATQPGMKIVIESPFWNEEKKRYEFRRKSISALALTDEEVENRKEEWKHIEETKRYVNPKDYIDVEPDIDMIFLDIHARKPLDVDEVDVVKVRRDSWDLFVSELREFGLLFFISNLALVEILPMEKTYFNIGIVALFSFFLSVAFIAYRIRSMIK